MASILVSIRLWSLLQVFLVISLFEFVNAAIILAFSSSLVLHSVLLVNHALHIKGIVVKRVQQLDVRSDVVAEIFLELTLCSLACVTLHSPVARCRVNQQPHSWSRAVLLPPGIWCRSPFYVWDEWRNNVTINSDRAKLHFVDWMFGFCQYEYEIIFKLILKCSEVFVLVLLVWILSSTVCHFQILKGLHNCAAF